MQGCHFQIVIITMSFICTTLCGCSDGVKPYTHSSTHETEHAPPVLATKFSQATTGTINGFVRWQGAQPSVPKIVAGNNVSFAPTWPASIQEKEFSNPNAPNIKNGKLAKALIFLEKVDLTQAHDWDLPPVQLRFAKSQLLVQQGEEDVHIGIVRVGTEIPVSSSDDRFHMLRGRGGDFFALTLPKSQQTRNVSCHKTGMIELSDAAEYFWLRRYLFVTDHPYATLSNDDGTFSLSRVPEGEYSITLFVPNWHIRDHDRSPESMQITRLYFHEPVRLSQTIQVIPGQTSNIEFSLNTTLFAPKVQSSLPAQ